MIKLTPDNIPNDYGNLINEFKPINNNIEKLKDMIINLPKNHHIYIITDENETLGSITLILEPKIIHNFGCVCHIEDVIVKKTHHSKGLGSKMIKFAKNIAISNKCYKIILNCDSKIKQFYIKNGFFESSCQMRMDI